MTNTTATTKRWRPGDRREATDAMIRVDGSERFRRYRWGAPRVRYLRWCDAHIGLGLTDAALG